MQLLRLSRTTNPKPGAPVAFADVELDDGTLIRDFRVIEKPGAKPRVEGPTIGYKNRDTGQLQFKIIVMLPAPVKWEVDMLILNAWLRERKGEDL